MQSLCRTDFCSYYYNCPIKEISLYNFYNYLTANLILKLSFQAIIAEINAIYSCTQSKILTVVASLNSLN